MIEPILKQLFSGLPKRTKEVLVRRAGLKNNKPETLEAIGKEFGVTRERVRQIEASGVRLMRQGGLPQEMKEFERVVAQHMERFNGVREEQKLLHELQFLFNDRHPASPARVRFVMDLSEKFSYVPETPKYWAFWATSSESEKSALKFLTASVNELKKQRSPVDINNLEPFAKKICQLALTRLDAQHHAVALAYFSLSKEMALNPFGEFGLTSWPEIIPRGVSDRVYRILMQERKPVHFKELAGRLNSHAKLASHFHQAWQKEIEVQTVHNELIKDPNFVLVGRGMYALKQWGYVPGTVKDVLVSLLKKAKRPLGKEEILAQIKAQRLVQENTVLINLQDRKLFERSKEGKYRTRSKTVEISASRQRES